MPDGTEEVIATQTLEDPDYSGVFTVIQNEEEEEVEATLSQEFDNIEDYELVLDADEDENEDPLVSDDYEYRETLLSEGLVNEEEESELPGNRYGLVGISVVERDDTFTVGETIRVHEMTNLCPGDQLILEEDGGPELASEEITVDIDCNDLRQVAVYEDGKITGVELINLWNSDLDYFVFDFDGSFDAEMPTNPTPIDEEEGTLVRATVLDIDGDEVEDATVHLGDLTNNTNETGVAEFENVESGANLEAVAYKDGYQPSEVKDIEVIEPEENPDEFTLELELEEIEFEEPRTTEDNLSSGDDTFVPTSGGGGATIGSFGGGGGGGASIGGGGSFIGGSGAFYGGGGASTGASTTTLSSSAPTSSPDPITVQEGPQRVFNVQDVDDSLIPENEEFAVDTTVTATGEEDLEDRVVVYKSEVGESGLTEIGNESVILPGGEETNTQRQDLSIEDEGEYRIYVSLNSTDEYQSAGVLDVFPEDRLDAEVDSGTITVNDDVDAERARTGDEVTVTVDSDDISTDSATVDIFKNGQRVESGVVNSEISYTETFDSPQYVQFHVGIQESQDMALLDTLVVTETVEDDAIESFNAAAQITDTEDNCLEDIGTSGQFDCEVDLENSEVSFNAADSEFELVDDEEEFDRLDYTWNFGEEDTQTVDSPEEEVTHEFVEDNVHLVEFQVDAELDGVEYSDRDSFVINAVEDPNEIATRIINTEVQNDTDIEIDIRNDRDTINENVKLQLINQTMYDEGNEEDSVVIEEEIRVQSDSTVTYRNTLDVGDFADESELEEGDEVPVRVELTPDEDTTAFVDETEEIITVPEASIDATVEGSVEVCEEDCE